MDKIIDLLYQLAARGFQLFLVHNGLGETILFLELLPEWKKQNQKKIFALTMENSRTVLCERCPAVEETLEVEPDVWQALAKNQELTEKTGLIDLMKLHFDPQIKLFGSHLADKLRGFLRLPPGAPRTRFSFSFSRQELQDREAFAEANSLDLSKLIFLVPDGFCFGDRVVTPEFWDRLCRELRARGFVPIFNSMKEIVAGVPCMFPDLVHLLLLVDACKKVVGVRTGLMDVVATFTDARVEVIYPDDENPIWTENEGLQRYPAPGKSLAYIEDGGGVSDNYRDEGIIEFVHTKDEVDIACILEDFGI